MKPKNMRHYKGRGNTENRKKRDIIKLKLYEKNKPKGFVKFRWQI